MTNVEQGYIEPLTEAGARAAAILTDPKSYGGAVAHRGQPCLVIYGVPAWIMPNGMVRIGDPDAPMIDAEHAARAIRTIRDEQDAAKAADYGAKLAEADARRLAFAEAVRSGKRVRIVCGPEADDPTLIVYAQDGMAMSESVAGWSAGVVEPVCALDSDFLLGYFHNRERVEVVAPAAAGETPRPCDCDGPHRAMCTFYYEEAVQDG